MRESEVGQANYCSEGDDSSQHQGHSRSAGCSKYRFSKGGEPPTLQCTLKYMSGVCKVELLRFLM